MSIRLLLIECADPNKAAFNKGPILCTPGNNTKFFGKLGVNDPNTMTIGINLMHLKFHIFCSSNQKSTYFKIFSRSLSMMFTSAGIATSISIAERSKLSCIAISGL